MEFITVEQFQEQPLKVQKVFIDWWQPEIGDIFDWIKSKGEVKSDLRKMECCNSENIIEMTNFFKGIKEGDRIPLFTEGQLRKFIEDKLDMKIQCEIHPLTLDYIILVKNNSGNKVWMHTGKEDLLQAYWKAACMIAKEEVDE